MTQLAQACLQGDFAAAREIQRDYLPLMQVNFVESNPIPVKCGDGADGTAGAGLPAADGAAVAASQQKIEKVLEAVGLLAAGAHSLQAEIERLFDTKPATIRRRNISRFSRASKRR